MANNNFTIEFADGTTADVQTTLEDRLAFEQALRKNKGWGKLEDNTLKMQPFLAWNAARRTRKTELTWTEFTTGDTAARDVSLTEEPEPADDELEVPGVGKDTPTAPSITSPWPSPASTAEPLGSGEPNPAHA